MEIPNLTKFSDSELVSRLKELRRKENEAISDLVLFVYEIDRRGYYRDLGYSSLFSYMTAALGYSEGGAQRRIRAARSLAQNPELYFKLREGRITLCAIAEVAKADKEYRPLLLAQSEGKSKREVERMVAAVLPAQSPRRETVKVRKVLVKPVSESLFDSAQRTPPPVAARTEERYTITLEVDKEFIELLEKAKALTGAFKNADVIKKSLKTYLERKSPAKREERRQKRKATAAPKATGTSRHIPNQVRDRVFVRDGGRCSFVASGGERCTETKGVHIDHVRPWAKGGGHAESNLHLLCPAHNFLMAEKEFGRVYMKQFFKK